MIMWYNKEEKNFNQNQQMIHQKNRMDPATTVPSSSGKWDWFWASVEVYSKIRNQFGMATYTKETEINNKRYNYSELTDVFAMFIFVSLPLGLVTGGLSGPPWWTFWFLQVGREFCFYKVTCVCLKKIQKSKKSAHVDLPFFIRKVTMWPDFGIGGLE